MPELGEVSCSEVERACLRADSIEELVGGGAGWFPVSELLLPSLQVLRYCSVWG